jgi:hypothetical protein
MDGHRLVEARENERVLAISLRFVDLRLDLFLGLAGDRNRDGFFRTFWRPRNDGDDVLGEPSFAIVLPCDERMPSMRREYEPRS